MARGRTFYLPALLVAAVLVACAVVLLAVSEEAGATFPGKNGRIAYSAFWPRDDVIYTINPDGSGKSRVTGGYLPSYSPDGERIAYSQFTQNDAEIYTINPDGSGKTQLTHNNTKDDNWPSYSPNGKRIAYTRTLRNAGGVPFTEIDVIFTVKVGGGGKRKVTNGFNPSYSPDGKRIVYFGYDQTSSKRFPDMEIYTINPDGSGRTQLTHNSKDDLNPDYSPDGKRIAYVHTSSTSDEESGDSDIYTIKVGGGDKSRVTYTDKADEAEPSYSPDGKRIAYALYTNDERQSDIYTIDASGGGRTRVTNTDDAFVEWPSWGSRP